MIESFDNEPAELVRSERIAGNNGVQVESSDGLGAVVDGESKAMRARARHINKTLLQLPELGSQAFWELTAPDAAPLMEPEVLLLAALEFARHGQKDSLKRIIEALYDRYDFQIRRWSANIPYVRNLPTEKRRELAEEAASITWMKMLESVQCGGKTAKAYASNFRATLVNEVKTNTRTAAWNDDVYVRSGAKAPEITEEFSEQRAIEHEESSGVNPRYLRDSFDKPFKPHKVNDVEEQYTLLDILPDSHSVYEYWTVEKRDELKRTLDESEMQLLSLLEYGLNRSEIALVLGIDRQTVTRRMEKLRVKLSRSAPD